MAGVKIRAKCRIGGVDLNGELKVVELNERGEAVLGDERGYGYWGFDLSEMWCPVHNVGSGVMTPYCQNNWHIVLEV